MPNKDFKIWFRRQPGPVTLGLVLVLVISTLFLFLTKYRLAEQLVFWHDWTARPWTLFTYPLVSTALDGAYMLIGFLSCLYVLNWMGTELELDLGRARFGAFLAAMIALPALFLWMAGAMQHYSIEAYGPWLPTAGLAMAWAARNPSASIRVWGVVPITAPFLMVCIAVGVAASAFIGIPNGNPVVALFGCFHLAVAWAFATNRLPFQYSTEGVQQNRTVRAKTERLSGGRGQVQYDDAYYDEVRRREKERAEQERLRKLLEGPFKDDL